MTEALSFLANMALITVIFMYFKQVMKSESTPNPSTWFIWLVVVTMNTITYYEVVSGDLVLWAITLTQAIGLTATFLYAAARGRFGRVGFVEVLSFLLALCVGVFWQTTGNAIVANLLLQVIFLISFVPTVLGLAKGELRERTPPWDMAVLAYSLMVIAIALDWKEGSLLALANPIINGILGNGSVALTIRLTRSKQAPSI